METPTATRGARQRGQVLGTPPAPQAPCQRVQAPSQADPQAPQHAIKSVPEFTCYTLV